MLATEHYHRKTAVISDYYYYAFAANFSEGINNNNRCSYHGYHTADITSSISEIKKRINTVRIMTWNTNKVQWYQYFSIFGDFVTL